MSDESRAAPFFLDLFNGEFPYSIFCKVEEGVPRQRRNDEVARLNNKYQGIIAEKKTLKACLKHMIETESYRFLSKWTYEVLPKPLRGHPDFPNMTEVYVLCVCVCA